MGDVIYENAPKPSEIWTTKCLRHKKSFRMVKVSPGLKSFEILWHELKRDINDQDIPEISIQLIDFAIVFMLLFQADVACPLLCIIYI